MTLLGDDMLALRIPGNSCPTCGDALSGVHYRRNSLPRYLHPDYCCYDTEVEMLRTAYRLLVGAVRQRQGLPAETG